MVFRQGVWVQVIDPKSVFYGRVGRVEGYQVHNGRRLCRLFGFWFEVTDLQIWIGAAL